MKITRVSDIARLADPGAPWDKLNPQWTGDLHSQLLGFDGLRFVRALHSADRAVELFGLETVEDENAFPPSGYFPRHRPRTTWRP